MCPIGEIRGPVWKFVLAQFSFEIIFSFDQARRGTKLYLYRFNVGLNTQSNLSPQIPIFCYNIETQNVQCASILYFASNIYLKYKSHKGYIFGFFFLSHIWFCSIWKPSKPLCPLGIFKRISSKIQRCSVIWVKRHRSVGLDRNHWLLLDPMVLPSLRLNVSLKKALNQFLRLLRIVCLVGFSLIRHLSKWFVLEQLSWSCFLVRNW